MDEVADVLGDDPAAPALHWSLDTGDDAASAVVVVAGVVCPGTQDGSLYDRDAETAEEAWAFEAVVGFASPVYADGVVYTGGGYVLHAVDAECGEAP